MATPQACRMVARGRVQGVNFRRFVQRKAVALGVVGYARNLPDGDAVEVYAEGDEKSLRELIHAVGVGPPLARVDGLVEVWSEPEGTTAGFRVL